MSAPGPGPTLLVLGDLGDERCGVGSSEAVLAAMAPGEVRALDPTAGSFLGFARRLRRTAHGAHGAVVAYPTLSQVERLRVVPRLLLLRALLGRRGWLRVHLHEFERLRRRQRLAVAVVVGLIATRVVVSSEREAAALRRRYRGWAGRSEVVVVPPANGSAPAALAVGHEEACRGTLGLVGQLRPDKGVDWLLATLGALDPRFDRLEIVGRDWDLTTWPESLLSRYEVVAHGQLPAAELPAVVSRWELALAPFEEPPHDGRLSLRTPLAHGVPTLTRGPRPSHLQIAAPHLLFDDEIDLVAVPTFDGVERAAGAKVVAELEQVWRTQLVEELFGP
ncbi:MAG: hypothetical protein Q8K58_16650 [Acidimicrobiales bacterium]|nr:hypothetical protein [Acidimicrobiales bacterium]